MDSLLHRENCSFCQLFSAMKNVLHVQMVNHLQEGHEGENTLKMHSVTEIFKELSADMQLKNDSNEELSKFHQEKVDINSIDDTITNTLMTSHKIEESNETSAEIIKTELISAHGEYPDLRGGNEDNFDDNLSAREIKSNSTELKDYKEKFINKFLCDICSKLFSRPELLLQHKEIHKNKRIKEYKCDECSKSFFTKGTLKTHKMIHSGEKQFYCDECAKFFLSKGALNTHKLIHSGEKPFCCDECGQNFRQTGALKNHQVQEHNSSSLAKQHSCSHCSKSFFAASYLRTHEIVHTGEKPFSCDVCLKAFGTNSHLIIHKRIHSGERPFECEKCPKSFRSSSKLNTHKRVHSGVKPYSCVRCSRSFAQSNGLKKHIKSCRNI